MALQTLPSPALAAAREEFAGGRGYLAACTVGLPPRATRAAVMAELDAAAAGRPDPSAASAAVERSRALFARLVGVESRSVAIGSQVSVVLPFVHSGRALRVRALPLAELAQAVRPSTALVAFSLVQSATGEVADADAIVAAAAAHGARTLCDATQAVGWLPVEASRFDALVCHAYKWLCAPRGVSFLTLSDDLAREVPPLFAGWYAGSDPWSSCYGGDVDLAPDVTRFDASPAWQAFIGAAPALALFAALDPDALHAHAVALAGDFRARLGLAAPERESAIVTWSDPDGAALARLVDAGIVASGRAGRARVAFHLFNDAEDVDLASRALGR